MNIRRTRDYICTHEVIESVQRDPTRDEQVTIDAYRDTYIKTFGRLPRGLHYMTFPGVEKDVTVWLPNEAPPRDPNPYQWMSDARTRSRNSTP